MKNKYKGILLLKGMTNNSENVQKFITGKAALERCITREPKKPMAL
jgi:hypothetical protein